MTKRVLIPAALFLMIGLTAVLLAFMPYHFYYVALDSGLDSRFLQTAQIPTTLLKGAPLAVEVVPTQSVDSRDRWRNFHIGNYVLPMPVRHPYFLLIPEIALDAYQKPVIAWELQNQNLKTEVRVKFLSPIAYEYPFEENLLFNLPIFKNSILAVPAEKIWQDLFMLELRLPSSESLGVAQWIRSLWSIPYTELAYRLFILKTRQALFPKDVASLHFDMDKQMGVLEVAPPKTDGLVEDNLRVEQTFLLREGLVQRLELTTRRYSNIAKSYRSRALTFLEWRASNPDENVAIYNDFNQLSYERKIDQEGMTYLFAGWTHVPKQEEFLRTMIQFLERGKKNLPHLKSLYKYAYDLFGTSFSLTKENLRETEQRKLERKISEELRGEIDKVERSDVVAPDGNFENEEDQVDFFLKKAKEAGSSDGSNILVE